MTTHPIHPDPTPIGEAKPVKPTATEVLDSLSGYDEIAIEKAFGADITVLARTNATTFCRALLFATFLHEGDKHDAAKKRALDLTIGQVNDSFGDEEDDPDLPGSESGKDET